MSDDGKAFTLSTSFKDIKSLIDNMHSTYNLAFIATIIPAFKDDNNYKYTQQLIANKAGIINWDTSKGLWKGKSKYGDSYVPDFFNKDLHLIWHDAL